MAKISIKLADYDKYYTDAFSKYIIAKYSDRFEISTITDEEVLREELRSNSKDVYLIEETILGKIPEPYEILNIICLSQSKLTNDNKGFKTISKYQNIEYILSEIVSMVDNVVNFTADVKNNNITKIVTLFSPIGGSGKTSIATSLATKLSRFSKKVLYINLESIPSTDYYFCGESDKTISNLLYGVLKGQNLPSRIEGSKVLDVNNGVFYFKPQDNPMEPLELSPENYSSLINSVRELGVYDFVIFDLSSYITDQNYSVLTNSDFILTPLLDDGISELRIRFYMEHLRTQKQDELVNKTIFILNKSDNVPEWANGTITKRFNIPVIHEKNMHEVIRLMTEHLDELFERELLT